MTDPVQAAADELNSADLKNACGGWGLDPPEDRMYAARIVLACLRTEFDNYWGNERHGGYLLALAGLIAKLEAAE